MKSKILLLMFALMITLTVSCDNSSHTTTTEQSRNITMEVSTVRDSSAINENTAEKVEEENVKMLECGTLTFRSKEGKQEVKLPLFGIAATYGIDDSNPPAVVPSTQLPDITFGIPADQRDQLAAYWVNNGFGGDGQLGILLLGPAGWSPVKAIVGANGSVVITLKNPNDSGEKLTYYDTFGGCQGCAISSIGSYFPTLRKWAEDQSFPGGVMKFKQQTLLSPQTIAYSREHTDPGYEINGVACQQHEPCDAWFRMEEISNAASKHSLARTVLNFFKEQYDLAK